MYLPLIVEPASQPPLTRPTILPLRSNTAAPESPGCENERLREIASSSQENTPVTVRCNDSISFRVPSPNPLEGVTVVADVLNPAWPTMNFRIIGLPFTVILVRAWISATEM